MKEIETRDQADTPHISKSLSRAIKDIHARKDPVFLGEEAGGCLATILLTIPVFVPSICFVIYAYGYDLRGDVVSLLCFLASSSFVVISVGFILTVLYSYFYELMARRIVRDGDREAARVLADEYYMYDYDLVRDVL